MSTKSNLICTIKNHKQRSVAITSISAFNMPPHLLSRRHRRVIFLNFLPRQAKYHWVIHLIYSILQRFTPLFSTQLLLLRHKIFYINKSSLLIKSTPFFRFTLF